VPRCDEHTGHVGATTSRVLVAGSTAPLSDAELYRSASGLGQPPQPSATHAIITRRTLLHNGQGACCRRSGTSQFDRSRERGTLRPATGTWFGPPPAAPMHAGCTQHVAAQRPGACRRRFQHRYSLASAELYDPTTGTWAVTGSLAAGRYGHPATLAANGQVLVAGGVAPSSRKRGNSTIRERDVDGHGQHGLLTISHTATLLPTARCSP